MIPMPPNEGNLPLIELTDEFGNVTGYRIEWRGWTIRQQFPWTRSVGEVRPPKQGDAP